MRQEKGAYTLSRRVGISYARRGCKQIETLSVCGAVAPQAGGGGAQSKVSYIEVLVESARAPSTGLAATRLTTTSPRCAVCKNR